MRYWLFLFACLFVLPSVYAGSASFVTNQYTQPSFNTYYGGSIGTYWPILDEKEQCLARQDVLMQVAPAGCQPSVVRSDLLAEQNVPVFCQLNALQINPLVTIKELESIRFTGNYPKEVSSVGFHPARAALRTRDQLLGDPLLNNVGYVVIVLKKQPKESELPSSVKLMLSANIKYDAGNARGVGKSEFLLTEQSDEEWTQAQKEGRQGFFNGKYQVRLEDADVRGATVGIYSGVRKLGEAQVEQGKQSSEIFLPGSYCRAGVRAELLGYEIGKERATLRITGTYGTETVDVYQGSSFLQGQCRLTRLVIDNRTGRTGEVEIKCASAKAFKLKLLPNAGVYEVFTLDDGSLITPSQTGEIDFGQRTPAYTSGRFRLSSIGALQHYNQTAQGQGWVNLSLTGSGEQVLWYRALLVGLQEHLKQQKTQNTPTPKVLREKSYASDIEANFSATIASYRAVAQQYPGEKGTDLEGIETYGEQALYRAAQLAGSYGKQSTQATLLQELLTTYPDSVSFIRYQQELTQLSEIDGSESSAVLSLQNVYRTITLTSLIPPAQTASVRLQINNEPVILHVGENWTRDSGFIRLSRLEADRVLLETNCAFNVRRAETSFVQVEERSGRGGVRTVTMGENDDGTICGRGVRIAEIDSEKLARIRLTTSAERTETTTNVSVQIGIEKRAIQLSPAKTAERIGNLNKSIQKWDQLNKNVGKVVTTMKAACFATAGVLTVKNFFAGLSGKGFARKEAMGGANGWTEFCRKQVGAGTDGLRTFDQCYLKYAPDIDADVAKRDAAVKQVNARITAIQKQDGVKTSEGFFGDSVNTDEAAKRYRTELQNTYGDTLKGVSLEHASYTELRELDMNLLLQQQGGGSEQLQKDARVKLEGIQKSAAGQALLAQQLKADAEVAQRGDIRGLVVAPNSQLPRQAAIISQAAVNTTGARYYAGDFKYYTKVIATGSSDAQGNTYGSDTYGLGLAKQSDGTYVVQEVFQSDGTPLPAGERERFITQYNVGSFKDSASSNWEKYKWDKPVIQYYETDPYKGLPALVPVDPDHGWYAATKQTLPAFGGLAGWESSGRVASFYLCNVGENRKPDVFNGYNDDSCTLINLASGQAADKVPGVSETRAQQLVKQAREALEEAARAHKQGAKSLRLQGSQHKTPYAVEKPAVSVPGVQCQDFMSPTECNLLFNVCDPVICPASRCDFGGKYPVQDVIQSGIIGSTLLCMPNFPEVKIPVCLSGIHAGIDAYTKILQAHRDCLQESLTSGRMVGICDQIYSIYSCEFFWRQLSPIANLVVPKLFEQAQGQGARGGGEYLTVQNAWTNTKQSTDYLTTVYGVNAFKAFQARSTEEVGGEVCKGFISGTFPGSFKSLVQPDSPVQFNAFFSTIKYTDATVPATSQYKVFYHIYAGKDQGISYRVFLKNPPATSYYASQPTIQVSSGFIGKGLFKDETKDFTAPEGYQELCVVINGDERCGFKQVSTSFAVNQLRDAVVADELKNTNIASEQACISGTVSAAALLNPNLNQMADEAADPAIYRRGIIRVCSSGNPGQTTDPSRFADVGYCGDMKLRCWLDRQSVQNAITDVNKGVKNETYQWFANQTLANLQKDGKVLGADAGFSELTRLEGVVSGLENYQGQKSRLSADQSTRLGLLFLEFGQTKEALFFNHHRARLGWLVGRAQEVLFKHTFAARADDTRQAGQLDKGILVRETKGVWQVKLQQNGLWERVDSYQPSDTEYWARLSSFQQEVITYLNEKTADDRDADILGKHHYLLEQPGVTVTADKLTDSDGYYYIPFGDSPSSSGGGNVAPSGTVVPGTNTPSSDSFSLTGQAFLHFLSDGTWALSLTSSGPQTKLENVDTSLSTTVTTLRLPTAYLPLLQAVLETNSYSEAQSLLHMDWEQKNFTIIDGTNVFGIAYRSSASGGANGVTPVSPSGRAPSSVFEGSTSISELFAEGADSQLATLCGVTHVAAVESSVGGGAALVAAAKDVDTYVTVLVENGAQVTRAGALTGNVVNIGGKSFVKSALSGEIIGTLDTSGRVVKLSKTLATQVGRTVPVASTAIGRGVVSGLSLEAGAKLVDVSGKVVGEFGTTAQLIKTRAGILKLVQKASPWFKVINVAGTALVFYDMLCTGYKVQDATIAYYTAVQDASLSGKQVDIAYGGLVSKLALQIGQLEGSVQELETLRDSYQGAEELSDFETQNALESIAQIRSSLDASRQATIEYARLFRLYVSDGTASSSDVDLFIDPSALSTQESLALIEAYKPVRTHLNTLAQQVTSLTSYLTQRLEGTSEATFSFVPPASLPALRTPTFVLNKPLVFGDDLGSLPGDSIISYYNQTAIQGVVKTLFVLSPLIQKRPDQITGSDGYIFSVEKYELRLKHEIVHWGPIPNKHIDLLVGSIILESDGTYTLGINRQYLATASSQLGSALAQTQIKYANLLDKSTLQGTEIYAAQQEKITGGKTGGKIIP